jgi:hypothetical protein
MKTVINKFGVNTTSDETVSLVVEGNLYVNDTNILEELKAMQKNLNEIGEIKKTLETLKDLVDVLGKGEADGAPSDAEASSGGSSGVAKKTAQKSKK